MPSVSQESELSSQDADIRPGKLIGAGDAGASLGVGVGAESLTSTIGGRAATVVDAMRIGGERKMAPRGRAVRARR